MKLFIFIYLFVNINILLAQTDYDLIIKKGIESYEKGDYDNAISIFQEGIIKEPENDLAIYEMALAYMAKKDYKMAITYLNLAIPLNGPSQLVSYNLLGSALNMIDEEKEAIKTFKTAIDKFGYNDELCYNLGLVYFKYEDFDDALEILQEGLKLNSNHASSHFLLGEVQVKEENYDKAIFSYYYFLMLEPASKRSKLIINKLIIIMVNKFNFLNRNNESTNVIYIPNVLLHEENNDFVPFFYNEMNKNKVKKEKTTVKIVGPDNVEFIIDQTIKIFNSNKLEIDEDEEDIWNKFYRPFFNDLKNANQIETFCYFICQSTSNDAATWLNNNPEKINSFIKWLQGN